MELNSNIYHSMRAFREPKNRNSPVNFLIIIQCKINIINLILLIKDSGKIETIIGNCCYENRTYIGYSKWAYCLCNLMMGWWRVGLTIGLTLTVVAMKSFQRIFKCEQEIDRGIPFLRFVEIPSRKSLLYISISFHDLVATE